MMQRIRAVLDKLVSLAQRKSDRTVIDIDLMLDYTRMVYADLLDLRSTVAARADLHSDEPTLDELTTAMGKQEGHSSAVPPIPAAAPAPLPAATGRKDIRQLIDLNEKYLLLSELFRNDVHAYEEAMKAINAFSNEQEALQWLGSRQWAPGSDGLATLRSLLKRFYS